MDVFSSNSKGNLTVREDNNIKRSSLQTAAIESAFCGSFERKEQYLCEGSISVGRVKLLRDFYEKSIFLSKNIKIRRTFYDLNPSVKERVRMLENIIVKQRI